MKKVLCLILMVISVFSFLSCESNNNDVQSKSKIQQLPDKIETVEQYIDKLKENLDIIDITYEYDNEFIDCFKDGIRFKYLDEYFELYEVNNQEFLDDLTLYNFIYNVNGGIFDANEFHRFINEPFLSGDLYTYILCPIVNKQFVLVPIESLAGGKRLNSFHALIFYYYEAII